VQYICVSLPHVLRPVVRSLSANLLAAEEIQDASITLPKALMWSLVINGTLAFLMGVTLIFTLGDVDSVLSTVTYNPWIQVFYNATQSYAGTNTMVAIVIILLVACCISEVATASRQIWAFSRDRGLPGSAWLSRVRICSIDVQAATDVNRSHQDGTSHYARCASRWRSAHSYLSST